MKILTACIGHGLQVEAGAKANGLRRTLPIFSAGYVESVTWLFKSDVVIHIGGGDGKPYFLAAGLLRRLTAGREIF